MLKRTITAIVALAIFIPVLYFSDTFIFPVAMAFLSVTATFEMIKCVGLEKNIPVSVFSYLTAGVLPLIPLFSADHSLSFIFCGCVVYMIVMFTITVFSRGKLDYTISASAFMSVFYISVSFSCIVLLRGEGKYLYLLVFIGPWMSDTFAYIFGKLLGRNKLIPNISPKKTVEGSIAGVLFAAISFVIYAIIIKTFFDKTATPHYLLLAMSGAVVSIISQIGDLTASVIKRRFGIKDYGWIFPGHGGVMDRFDSVILTAPVLYIISQIPIFANILI